MDTNIQPHFATTAELLAIQPPDFPSFLFSERQLRHSARSFISQFDGLVTYAVKSNPSDHILTTLAQEGIKSFDVASINEMRTVLVHVPDAVLHYNNPIRSRREITSAWHEFEIKSYSIDDAAQLVQIASIIPPSKLVEIAIRFKSGKTLKSYDFGTKFGIPETGAAELARQVADLGYTPSLSFHVGSQCEDAQAFERHIAAAGRIAQQASITLKRLNIGGGFPADYPSSSAPPLNAYFDIIQRAVKNTFGNTPPELIIEPGRALSAPCTSLLLRVKHQRHNQAVYLNDGIYGSLMEVKFMPILPPVRVWRGTGMLQGPTSPFTIFGPTCDSYDALPQLFDLPTDIQEDDWVEFGQMGAYSQASTTSFNGFDTRLQFFVDEILM